ncbi:MULTISPECIES: DNA/RNA nuclease SfsA [Aeromonas]|uniref:Sugar fermentation stimulation protein homolog n=1 Tax=Aeromonas sanarellii TaxID=633415 RepID=A0ABS4B788_9GAMM|nr:MULTISPECIES: DNA/RNA nuclease SfsA [Aeromonas]MBP0603354.1 DNA/RNA nuclease SfsA [Aeromonas sanarellii]MEB6607102.1 DNA/RNA nuclease SfsA [Aeromonas sanarellii]QXC30634.1 DNA/RNA nuclease SfsA [Aeromonas sp. FDAARGOS 1409]QXW30353.1 DNA/RNA nuclease SfsA [Aeromonas sanarellii]WOX49105.1 DNA/RNA nuclease SfsA [Aeromonas sp. XH]
MIFAPPLQSGQLIARYKRFLTDVQLEGGEVITLHCANTGAMTGCAEPGTRVWYSTSNNPRRKLAHSWEIAESPAGHFICVNTARANQIARELIEQGAIAPLAGYARLRTEVKYGEENSRIDLLLEDDERPDCYIEVKSVTLLDEREQPGMGYFPDAVTARGAKHLRELMAMKAAGHRAVLLFMVLHSGIERMRPAAHIDPLYSQLIEQAMAAGVEILCYRPHVGVQGIVAQDFIPFESGHMLPEGKE